MQNPTISISDLTPAEKVIFGSLVRLGDSEDLALWTIENDGREKVGYSKETSNLMTL
jgi:hypothetical protein